MKGELRWCLFAAGVACLVLGVESLRERSVARGVNIKSETVIEGSGIQLKCSLSSEDSSSFIWTLNGSPVKNESRRYQKGSDLIITRTDRFEDLGQFKCIGTSGGHGAPSQSQPMELDILWISEVKVNPVQGETRLQESGEMQLKCKAEGNPELRYEWYQNGVKLMRNERTLVRQKKLQIANLTVADNGVYSCKAHNSAGSALSVDTFALKLQTDNEGELRIVEVPQDIVAKANESSYFTCIFENVDIIEWYAPSRDSPLVNSTKVTVYPNGTLLVNQVRKEDEGVYKCVGVGKAKEIYPQTFSARLQLAELHDFPDELPSDLWAVDEKGTLIVPKNAPQFEMYCVPPKGMPRPKIWWEDISGNVISDSGRVRIEDQRLVIAPVKKSDAGTYHCVAQNVAGTKKKPMTISVANAPTIATHPSDTIVEEGTPAFMNCLYTGIPYPRTMVRWLKDDKYIRASNVSSHYLMNPNNGTLIVTETGIEDVGSYVCEVISRGFPPLRSKEATLAVKEMLKFAPPPVNRKLELGSSSKIHCKARGYLMPEVKWVKEGLVNWPQHVADENGTLHFRKVKSSDSGRYSCSATNGQGTINATIQVDVIVQPKFVVTPTDTEAIEGDSVMLQCEADGDPKPTIQWDKDNVLNGFDAQRFDVLLNGTLFLREVHLEDGGKYGCTAGNSGGFKRTEVTLVVKTNQHFSSNPFGANTEDETQMTRTVSITLGAAALYMLLVMVLMVWCRYRRAKRKAASLPQNADNGQPKAENAVEMRDQNKASLPEHHRLLPSKEMSQSQTIQNCRVDGDVNSQTSSSQGSKRSKSPYDRLQYPRKDLQTLMLLGHGEFGDVYLAKAPGIREEPESIVMVKALQTRDESIHLDFKREMDMFHKLDHERVGRLLGICRESEPFLLVMEYSDWGDLKQFLLATRKDNLRKGLKPTPLTLSQIVGISHQIAQAMEYLTNSRMVHKDLATRNCLITSKLDVKISSTSLSKDTYSAEYVQYRNRDIAVRWAPHEAVLEDEWSAKSDVWSFAVVVWEIFNQAELPFPEKSDDLVIRQLQQQELGLDPPPAAPQGIQELLATCWNKSPKERPSFSEVVAALGYTLVNSQV